MAVDTLHVVKLYQDSEIPVKPTDPTDSGFDVFANNFKFVYLKSHSLELVDGAYVSKPVEIKTVFPEGAEAIVLEPGQRCLIGTGVAASTGVPGTEIQVRPRSGASLKEGLTVVNTPGTVDVGYSNEIGVILENRSQIPQRVKKGDRIAQIVIAPVILANNINVTDNLPVFDRGLGGFGSSGK